MRNWTVLIYMAADNDLGVDGFASRNLHQLEKIGSTNQVAMLVQVARFGGGANGSTLRGLINQDPNWKAGDAAYITELEDIGETDTGLPETLTDFIRWGVTSHPADRYALIIWGHGTGWRAPDIEGAVGKIAGEKIELAARGANFGNLYQTHTRGILFRDTLEATIESFLRFRLLPNLGNKLLAHFDETDELKLPFEFLSDIEVTDIFARAVAIDTTNLSALDSAGLEKALTDARDAIVAAQPNYRLSLIGFDACLMAGVEVLYQLRDLADFLIGSEEEEPRTGWRYDLVSEIFNQTNTTETDSSSIVDAFMEAQSNYLVRLVTLSSVRCSASVELVESADRLGACLIPVIDSANLRGLQISEKTATRFRGDQDFIDFGHLLKLLEQYINDSDVQQVIAQAQDAYKKTVFASRFAFGRQGDQPTGLSIYFPTMPRIDPAYMVLDVSEKYGKWIAFLKKYHVIADSEYAAKIELLPRSVAEGPP